MKRLPRRPIATLFAARVAAALCACMASVGAGARDLPPLAGAPDIAQRGCQAIAARVDAFPGDGPVLLRSYDIATADDRRDVAALRDAAFVYDESLAVIALLACGKPVQAARIGEALRLAATGEARLRNTYHAGAVKDRPATNGWWQPAPPPSQTGRWLEDGYGAGTATGNVAWVGLALLWLDEATHDVRWREAAERLGDWVEKHTVQPGHPGFRGGIEGFDDAPHALGWKSTEHNLDLDALFAGLAVRSPGTGARARWERAGRSAAAFVDSQWDPAEGRYGIGTVDDGVTPNRTVIALDVQLWSQLRPARADAARALDFAEHALGVPGGFDFNGDRDGLWVEGTAQAALAYRVAGRDDRAATCLATIAGQFSPGGYLYATREDRVSTGLKVSSQSTEPDFFYFRRPHLGATAWAVLAATGRNPYVAAPSGDVPSLRFAPRAAREKVQP